MASIKQLLCSYPWKNYKNFNWNGLFICPTIHFSWLQLALSSRKYPNTMLNFDVFGNSQHSMLVKRGFSQTTSLCSYLGTIRRSQSNHKFWLSIQSAGIARYVWSV